MRRPWRRLDRANSVVACLELRPDGSSATQKASVRSARSHPIPRTRFRFPYPRDGGVQHGAQLHAERTVAQMENPVRFQCRGLQEVGFAIADNRLDYRPVSIAPIGRLHLVGIEADVEEKRLWIRNDESINFWVGRIEHQVVLAGRDGRGHP